MRYFLREDAHGRPFLSQDVDLSLLLRDGARVTNGTVQEVAEAIPSLTRLDLTDCAEVTDAGLWSLARVATSLRALHIAGLSHVTHVGLRSIALRCRDLEELDAARCAAVDDLGMRVVASGLWGLRRLILRDCTGIADGGLCETLRCCRHITDLDISRCPNISDKSLSFIARYATGLRHLRAVGMRYCSDEGFVQVLRAAPALRELDLSDCPRVTADSLVPTLVTTSTRLESLALDGLPSLTPTHAGTIASSLAALTSLSLARCPGPASPRGCAAIAAALWVRTRQQRQRRRAGDVSTEDTPEEDPTAVAGHTGGLLRREDARQVEGLLTLRLGGTDTFDDDSARALASTEGNWPPRAVSRHISPDSQADLSALRDLDLSGSPALGPEGVQSLVLAYSRLTTLRLDRCRSVRREFITALASELLFVRAGRAWFGLEPLPDAEERMQLYELRVRQWNSAIRIQAVWRRALAWREVARRRHRQRGMRALVRIQARWRGGLARERVMRLRRRIAFERAARSIQHGWERFLRNRAEKRRLQAAELAEHLNKSANQVQRVYRGHVARVRVRRIQDAQALVLAEDVRREIRRARAALQIQCAWRACVARDRARLRRVEVEAERAERLRRNTAARRIQYAIRCALARRELARRRAARALALRRARAALTMQCAWRRYVAVCELRRRQALAQHVARHRAATRIQAIWRGARARHLAAVVRAFAALHAAESDAATVIQAAARGRMARARVAAMRAAQEADERVVAAATQIQAGWRGFKGRRLAAVARALLEREKESVSAGATTQADVDRLVAELQAADRRLAVIEAEVARVRARMKDWASEAEALRHVGAKEVDSSKITGTRQRYEASWLRARLVEAMGNMQTELRRLDEDRERVRFVRNDTARRLRSAQRDVAPGHDDVIAQVVSDRRERFRADRAVRAAAAARIQALVRGHAVRCAVRRGANPWVELQDPATGSLFYVNAFTQRLRRERPVDFDVWGGGRRQTPATPETAAAAAEAPTEAQESTDSSADWASLYGLEDVGDGWFRGWDDSAAAFYWYHAPTGQYRWTPWPEQDGQLPQQPQSDGGDAADSEQACAPDPIAVGAAFAAEVEADAALAQRGVPSRTMFGDWVEMFDAATGYVYYFNQVTGESTWSLPPPLPPAGTEADSETTERTATPAAAAELPEARSDSGPQELTWLVGDEDTLTPQQVSEGRSGLPPRLVERLRRADREAVGLSMSDRRSHVQFVRARLQAADWLTARTATEHLIVQQRMRREAQRTRQLAAVRAAARDQLEAERLREDEERILMYAEDVDVDDADET